MLNFLYKLNLVLIPFFIRRLLIAGINVHLFLHIFWIFVHVVCAIFILLKVFGMSCCVIDLLIVFNHFISKKSLIVTILWHIVFKIVILLIRWKIGHFFIKLFLIFRDCSNIYRYIALRWCQRVFFFNKNFLLWILIVWNRR